MTSPSMTKGAVSGRLFFRTNFMCLSVTFSTKLMAKPGRGSAMDRPVSSESICWCTCTA